MLRIVTGRGESREKNRVRDDNDDALRSTIMRMRGQLQPIENDERPEHRERERERTAGGKEQRKERRIKRVTSSIF
jgi:hypothetical protein